MTLGAVSFAVPWALAGLLALPVIWWLLRVTPPLPTIIQFPPVRLLMGLGTREESAAKTPLWLLFVRLVLAAMVILAAAHPVWNAGARLGGKGPVIVIIDDGWAAASNWAARKALVVGLADQAERESRPMAMITTAAPSTGSLDTAVRMMPAAEARTRAEGLQPKPWPTDR
ncbi:MAG: BatA domain-containing protein, partial [Rhodospirillales bacterium]|nr:BatA domain-containing protein [Rhodospirillales bacterium]